MPILSSFPICCANNSWDGSTRAAQSENHALPPLSASRALARSGGGKAAAKALRRKVLGQTASRFWRSECAASDCWACAGGARRKSNRSNLYRRSQRRLALRRPVYGRICQSAELQSQKRWSQAKRLLYHSGGTLRAARKQAQFSRISSLPSLLGRRNRAADHTQSRHRLGKNRVRFLSCGVQWVWRCHSETAPKIRPWCCRRSVRRSTLDLLLSSEPAKHVYWQTDPGYVRQCFRSGKGRAR